MYGTINDVYNDYANACGSETPARDEHDLKELMHAADVGFSSSSDLWTPFWEHLVFPISGDRWGDGGIEWPTTEQFAAFDQAIRDTAGVA